MKLVEIMSKDLVFPELRAEEKSDALLEMIEGVSRAVPELKRDELFQMIMEREKLSSTGIGSGIAIPHAKISSVRNQVAAFGRSRTGIDFNSIDQKPAHLIFMIIGPQGANEAHLKALARISKFLHDAIFREHLLTLETGALIYEAISKKDAEY